jgi:hypothetical protein
MSYLNPLRLHFAGSFQAAVSTINNTDANFELGNQNINPSWNPQGSGDWRLIGCSVTSAYDANGAPVSGDPVLQCLVADSDRAVPAKLVDLDPDQQGVSQVWGMDVRICDAGGNNLLRGRYEVAPFTDLWDRVHGSGPGDANYGAMYQSTLYDLEWGDVSASPLLSELRGATDSGRLSIKFNVDGYDDDSANPGFTIGRVVGTIGPWAEGEPHHFVAGRQLLTTLNGIVPSAGINYCHALVDEQAGKVLLDLGNALPTTGSGGPLADLGEIALTCGPVDLGGISYTEPGWYEATAGVVALPAGRSLTSEELAKIAQTPLSIVGNGTPPAGAAEDPSGAYVRADNFVFRLDPGEVATARVWATRYGKPYAGAQVQVSAALMGAGDGLDAIEFPAEVVTGPRGIALLPVAAYDPGYPRDYIDGQVYAITPTLPETATATADPFNFVSLLVWSGFKPDEPLGWMGTPRGSLYPIFAQYAQLYPVMARFLDLSSYEQVTEPSNLQMLRLAFGLDPSDPNSMPVTRDLSPSKRRAILRWMDTPGPDGKPLFGQPPPQAEALVQTVPDAPAPPPAYSGRGGKTEFLDRGTHPAGKPPTEVER